MRRRWLPWLAGAGIGLVWACSDGGGADDCPVGSSGCACTSGQGCDPGLVCFDGTCAPVGGDDSAGTTDGSASNTNSNSNSNSNTQGTADDDPSADDDADSSGGPGTSASSGGGDGPKLDVGSGETGLPGEGCQRIDMLFVLDSSGSMIEERNALAATGAFTSIVNTLSGINGGGIEYRIAVTDDKDSGYEVPPGWAGDPWFDSTELTVDEIADAFNGAVGQIGGEPPLGCEHVLTSAVDLLDGDASGFVREDALLVLVLVTDVDDYGAYDQQGGNDCGIGCATAPDPVAELVTRLVDDVKGGQMAGVAGIVVAGDPNVNDGVNFCNQPGSCGCGGFDCGIFHADRLWEFAESLGTNGYTADLCIESVPDAVETALTASIDLACMNFEPEG
jgi:hypothetical protein